MHVQVQGQGSVSSSPAGIACAQNCQASFPAGTSVVLTATPDARQTFSGWSGACSGTGACASTLLADATVIANFVDDPPPLPKHSLKISIHGAGSVTSEPTGIFCAGECEASFDEGAVVALVAVAGSGAEFNSWTGACTGTRACSVEMTSDVQVNAFFEAAPNAASCLGIRAADPVQQQGTAFVSQSTWNCLPPLGDGLGELAFGMTDPEQQAVNVVVFAENFRDSTSVLGNLYGSALTHLQQQSRGFLGWKQGMAQDPAAIALTYWDPGTRETMFGTLNGLFRSGVIAAPESSRGLLLVGELDTATPAVIQAAVFLQGGQSGPKVAWGPVQLASHGSAFGAGIDALGRFLIIMDGSARFGAGVISAQWLGSDGAPLTDEFPLLSGFVPGPHTWFETSALIGGGVVVRRIDLSGNVTHGRVLVALASGSVTPVPPPSWMTARPDTRLKIARDGKAYAVLPFGASATNCSQRVELIAPDGTFCSASTYTIQPGICDTADIIMGEDGTILQTAPEVVTAYSDGNSYKSCTWHWWSGTLR